MRFVGETHIGLVRKNNEDSIFISNTPIGITDNIYIVADGMGGHSAGEVASNYAIHFFIEYLENADDDNVFSTLKNGIQFANEKIYEKAAADPEKSGMGTTLTIGTIKDGKLYVCHVGDSRLYILSETEEGQELRQITKDHTFVNEMLAIGQITKEEAENHPNKNLITRAVGVDSFVEIDEFLVDLEKGDKVLMCSDGLNGMISDEDIKNTISKGADLEELVQELIKKALGNGGFDNISVILGKFLEVE